MICEKQWAEETGSRYLGTCRCPKCKKEKEVKRKLERATKILSNQRKKRNKAKKIKDIGIFNYNREMKKLIKKGIDLTSEQPKTEKPLLSPNDLNYMIDKLGPQFRKDVNQYADKKGLQRKKY